MSTADNPSQRGVFGLVLRNITSSWAGLLVTTLISFVLAPVVVHNLGSVYYGLWALLMQFTGYLWLFDFGVRESVVKYVAEYHAANDRGRLEATVRTAISVYTLVSLAALAVVAAMSAGLPYLFNVPPDAVSTARVAAFITGATVAQSFLANVFVGVLMGLHRIYLVSQVGIFFSLFRAAGTYLLLVNGYGLIGLSALNLLVSVANSVLVWHYCRVYLPDVPFRPLRPARADVSKLLHYGKWVLLANVGDKIVFATDAIVIGMFLPIAALTPYAIAGTLITNMRQVVMAMAAIFNPLTSSLRAGGGDAALELVSRSGAKGAMIVGLPFCIGFIALGERFVQLWMGPEHATLAGQVMSILSIGYIIGLPYYTISGVLYGLNEHRRVALLRLLEGGVKLALSVALIQRIGLIGVAIGTAIPHIIVVGWILPAALPAVFPINLKEYYVKVYGQPLMAAVPFAAACWFVREMVAPADLAHFFLWAGLSVVAYAVPVWAIALSPEERNHLLRALRITPRPVEKLS